MLSCSKNDLSEPKVPESLQLESGNGDYSGLRQSQKEISYDVLQAFLPESYPINLSEFKVQDFEDIALKKSEKTYSNVEIVKGNTLDEIIEATYKKYPSFDQFEPQAYKGLFPKLSENEIIQNKEIILDFTEKMMAFDVSISFAKLEDAKYVISNKRNRDARGYISGGTWLNEVCTVSIIISHLRLDINGLWSSVEYANSLSAQYGLPATNDGNGDRMDALRHGLWGIFIGKFGTHRFSNPNKAKGIIKDLLDAHECGQGGLDGGFSSAMDLHNNKIALKYYRDNVVVWGPWWNKSTLIQSHPGYIAIQLSLYPVDLVSTTAEMNQRNDVTLVRYR